MTTVETATGSVPAEQLGTTLMHEHVFVTTPDLLVDDPTWWDEDAGVDDAVKALDDLVDAGVDTIVDLTVLGLGRDLRRLRRVAERTRCQIVCATGYYTYDRLAFAWRFRPPGTGTGGGDPLTDLFVRDLTDGVPGTGVKAAILKCATDHDGLTPDVERILRAVAAAHRETGAPISTHTHAPSRVGLDQVRVLAEEGVDLERVVIGHSGDTTDLDYLGRLLDVGVTLGMDRFGVDIVPFEDRVATVATLCERGYAAQLVLSHDAMCHCDWFDWPAVQAAAPDWHYRHVSDDVVPALRARGVTQDQLDQMLVHTPRRLLTARS